MIGDTLLSPDAFVCRLPLFLVASANGTSSSFITSDGLLSAISDCFSSLVASGDCLYAVFGCLLSLIASSGLLSTILGCPLSSIISGGLLSTVSGRFLSSVVGSSPLSAILGHLLSFVTSGGFLSAVLGRLLSPVPLAGFRALFLTSTLSYVHCFSLPSSPLFHFFLPSLPTPLARNPALLSGKRLFNPAFITQKPIASTQEEDELDLSFGQYSYSMSVKMNRSWQSELYDPKPVCLLEAILLLSFLF